MRFDTSFLKEDRRITIHVYDKSAILWSSNNQDRAWLRIKPKGIKGFYDSPSNFAEFEVKGIQEHDISEVKEKTLKWVSLVTSLFKVESEVRNGVLKYGNVKAFFSSEKIIFLYKGKALIKIEPDYYIVMRYRDSERNIYMSFYDDSGGIKTKPVTVNDLLESSKEFAERTLDKIMSYFDQFCLNLL